MRPGYCSTSSLFMGFGPAKNLQGIYFLMGSRISLPAMAIWKTKRAGFLLCLSKATTKQQPTENKRYTPGLFWKAVGGRGLSWDFLHPCQGLGCPCVLLSSVGEERWERQRNPSLCPGTCLEWGDWKEQGGRGPASPLHPRSPCPGHAPALSSGGLARWQSP